MRATFFNSEGAKINDSLGPPGVRPPGYAPGLGHVCDIFDIDHVLTQARTEKLHNVCLGNTSQVPSNKLMT